jgi:hypothetical protein
MERSVAHRTLAIVVVVSSLGTVIVPDQAFGRGAGFGGRAPSISSGLRGSSLKPTVHASPPAEPLPNRRQLAVGVPPRPQFGLGFPFGDRFAFSRFGYRFPFGLFGYGLPFDPFGFGLLPGPYDFGFPPTQYDVGAPPPVAGCPTFYCTYYDPSESTYVDPYYGPWTRDPSAILGLIRPIYVNRPACNSETVTVSSGDNEERTIKVVRC